jgi:excisionase family DNA binding protein
MNESLAVEIQPEKQICTRTQFKDYPDVLTVQQTAELLSVCKNTVYKLIRDQELPCRRIGSAIRIRKNDVSEFMRQ